MLTVGAVLLARPGQKHAVSAAAKSLSVGKVPSAALAKNPASALLGATHWAKQIQKLAWDRPVPVPPPGTIVPPPPGGYNVFDPHYSHDGPLSVTTGVFTGHSMGSKGGPLTFGDHTYKNVFDPTGGSDMGPCDPGGKPQKSALSSDSCRKFLRKLTYENFQAPQEQPEISRRATVVSVPSASGVPADGTG